MAGSCLANAEHQACKTSPNMDTRGKKEKRPTKRNLEKDDREGKKRAGILLMARSKINVEGTCERPDSPNGETEISQDYHTQRHWDNIPTRWKTCLGDTDPTELACLLEDNSQVPRVWPLSLLAFRQCTQTYSLTRSQQEVKVHDLSKLQSHDHGQDLETSLYSTDESNCERTYSDCLRKHVKPKKLHEIQCLGKTLRILGDVCDCQQIVDVGAGQGHLSRLLTFQHGFKVTTVEAEGCHAPKAQKYDRDAQMQIIKAKQKRGHDESESEADLPDHVTCYITANTTEGEFLDIVQRSFRRTKNCSGHTKQNYKSPEMGPKQSRLMPESKSNSDFNLMDVVCVSKDCNTGSKQFQQPPHCETESKLFQQPPHSDTQSKLFQQPPHSDTQSKLFQQPPHSDTQSKQFQQPPHSDTQSKQFQQPPHSDTQSKQFQQPPHSDTQSKQFQQPPHSDTQSKQFQQPPHSDTQSKQFQQPPPSDTQSKQFQQPPHSDTQSKQFQQPPPSDTQSKLFQQPPHSDTQSKQFQQPPHSDTQSKQFQQPPHSDTQSKQFQQPPHSDTQSKQFQQPPHSDTQSKQFQQPPHSDTQSKQFQQPPPSDTQSKQFQQPPHSDTQSKQFQQPPPSDTQSKLFQQPPHSDTNCDKCKLSSLSDCPCYQTSDHISHGSHHSSSGRDSDRRFLLTGLHACGDLTPTMLRVFTSCPDIQGLASVGCCYMKLSTAKNVKVTPAGYPMSDFVSKIPHSILSYEAREMACHFADSYIQRLKDNPPSLKLHCYRAALQWIIIQLKPNFVTGAQKLTIRKAESLTFPQYVKLGLHRLGLDDDVPEEILERSTALLAHWREVVAFYTIRLSLSPVVETLLLLDRQLYLYEQGFPSLLKPVFDPKTSPRNFVLLARK